MRSRYQGNYIDRHIHLFTYNIIAYAFENDDNISSYQFNIGASRMRTSFLL